MTLKTEDALMDCNTMMVQMVLPVIKDCCIMIALP